jgi:hypothetical protein
MTEVEDWSDDVIQFRRIGTIKLEEKVKPNEIGSANFLCVSNKFGYTLIGRPDGFLFIQTNKLLQLCEANKADYSSFQKVNIPSSSGDSITSGLRRVSISSDELTISAFNTTELFLFDVRSINKGVSSIPIYVKKVYGVFL